MARLRKACGQGLHDISPEDSVDCSKKAFVPDDFADADCFKMSQDSSMDDGGFDKALFDFYVNHKVKYLKRKITTAGQRNVVSYLDRVHFGLHPLPDVKPRILVWRGNKIKEFSELDKNNSRSYGKRPLKRLSPSIFLPKSCEKHSSSAVHEVVTPLIPFATKVERRFAGRFGIENVKQLIGLVQSSNADKPDIFREWSESLVIKVLDSLASSSFNVTDGFSPRLNAKVNFQNISSTPTLKISSNVQHSSQQHFGDCPSVHDQSNKVQNMAKDSSNVTSESSKVNIGVSPVIPKSTNVDDPIVNPFLSEAAKIPKELSLRAVSDIGHVDACESGVDPVKRVLLPKVPGQPEVVNEGTSPCTAQVHMDIPRSSTIPSASPLKNRKPAITSVVFEISSMSNLIGATNSNIPHPAAPDVCNVNIIDNDLDF